MTITYPRSLPTEMVIERITIKPKSTVGISRSLFTGQEQTFVWPGQWWEAEVSVAPCNDTDGAIIAAWLTSMNGREKTFLLGDPMRATARGSASSSPGTPLVNGANQVGSSLAIDGCPNGATGYLKAGDFIQLGSGSSSRLYMVLEDASTNGSGQVTLSIWPSIQSSPADNAAVVVASAVGTFRLAEGIQWDESTVIYGFTFSAIGKAG